MNCNQFQKLPTKVLVTGNSSMMKKKKHQPKQKNLALKKIKKELTTCGQVLKKMLILLQLKKQKLIPQAPVKNL